MSICNVQQQWVKLSTEKVNVKGEKYCSKYRPSSEDHHEIQISTLGEYCTRVERRLASVYAAIATSSLKAVVQR